MMMSWKNNFLFFISSNNSTMSGVVVRDHVADVQHVRARVRIPSTLRVQFMFSLRPTSSSSKSITLQFV